MRKVDEESSKIKKKVIEDLEEGHRLKLAEKETQLKSMQKEIDSLKRKSEQGSQQTQGEVLELDLEERLNIEFPHDDCKPVPKGVKGADILQLVKTTSGKICGKILWESKRTKNWSKSWIPKLKDDQRRVKADVSVLMSEVLPENVNQFKNIKGVWVTDISSAMNLATLLRIVLLRINREKNLQDGKKEKMELVYNYLTGTEFRNRIEGIVEGFVKMKNDIDKEKLSMERIWSKREQQIKRIVSNIVGMRGDLEGMTDSALPAIKMLELSSE